MKFAIETQIILQLAEQFAYEQEHEFFGVEHLLFALLHDKQASQIVTSSGGNVKALRAEISAYLSEEYPKFDGDRDEEDGIPYPKPTIGYQRVIHRAAHHVQHSGGTDIESKHLLVALYAERDSFATAALETQGASRLDVVNFISHGISKSVSDLNNPSVPSASNAMVLTT